jgi:2-methylcitrate dehydratase PrpD
VGALLDEDITLDTYEPVRIAASERAALMSKTTLAENPVLTDRFSQ